MQQNQAQYPQAVSCFFSCIYKHNYCFGWMLCMYVVLVVYTCNKIRHNTCFILCLLNRILFWLHVIIKDNCLFTCKHVRADWTLYMLMLVWFPSLPIVISISKVVCCCQIVTLHVRINRQYGVIVWIQTSFSLRR